MKHKAGYIDIKEASKLVSVHPDTIRRLVKQHIGSNNIYKGKSPKAPYLINKDWLLTTYGLNEPHTAPVTGDNQKDDTTPTPETDKGISAVVEALTKQLEAKDSQIATLQEIIKDKEANTTKLQDQFQQLLATAQLPAKAQTIQQHYEAETTPTEPQVYSKVKTPQSKVNKATKQAKGGAKATRKQPPKKADSPKPDKPQKKRWWRR